MLVLQIDPVLTYEHDHDAAGGNLPLDRLKPVRATIDAAHV
jgi:hypothetical protein